MLESELVRKAWHKVMKPNQGVEGTYTVMESIRHRYNLAWSVKAELGKGGSSCRVVAWHEVLN